MRTRRPRNPRRRSFTTLIMLGLAAVMVTGCSTGYQTAYDPTNASVYNTPDDDGMLVFTLSASDTLGRHLYHDEFQGTQVVAIQMTEPGFEYAEAPTDPTDEEVVSVPTDYE